MSADTTAFQNFCPGQLFSNVCYEPASCTLDHDVQICELCAVVCSPAANYSTHMNGQKHRMNEADTDKFIPTVSNAMKRCTTCSRNIPRESWLQHLRSDAHYSHLKLATLRAAFEQTEFDKQGVVVSHTDALGVDFGVLNSDEAAAGVEAEIHISSDNTDPVTMVGTEVHSRVPNHATLFTLTDLGAAPTVIPGRPLVLTTRFCHSEIGRYEARLELTFQGASGAPFVIARRLLAVVGEATDRELLKPVRPYAPARRTYCDEDLPVVSGRVPPTKHTEWARELLHFPIPPPLRQVLESGPPQEVSEALRERCFTGPLSPANYLFYFQTLLWIEEHRTVKDLQVYNLPDVAFTQKGSLYTVLVHGLSEKRPSIVRGDVILAQEPTGSQSFQGFVHDVRAEEIYVHFHGTFQAIDRRYNVFFQLNRTTLRRQHQALLAPIPKPERLLFPEPGQEGLASPVAPGEPQFELFDISIGGNAHQLQAVKSILSLRPGTAPFVVFGPPGTGKTVTIVEAIRQILDQNPHARILACAPSNSAADLIAQRLLALSTEEMFRCNAAFREPGSIPPLLVPYTLREGNQYVLPSLGTLMKYKVVVATCTNASFAYNIGVPGGHWSHVFVDEAGQASEPELLTAIKPLNRENTRVILSGDPKQLGPVIRSSIAREFGMDRSYLDRLLGREMYSAECGRGTAYIKLIQNYRSHPAILRFPNEKFYDDELEVCGPEEDINSLIRSSQLVEPGFPVVFHAISGSNVREAFSPSFFNIEEALQVKSYILKLLHDRRNPITAHEIGVISPYHAQVRKIRRLLSNGSLSNVKVGSVEEFQGQERRVVILSTVRSSTDLLAYDAKFALGFLSNPRRFNVAVTRAKALLIVVGDAPLLSIDPLWRAFMNYVHLNGGWRGDEPTWDTTAAVQDDEDYANELCEAIAAEMSTAIALLGPQEDMEGEANVERDWNNDGEPAEW